MNYSICIRTLGTAKEKYERLLSSIEKLSIKPKEVIIVIPKGYDLPNITVENQRIVYSEKGMLLQRIVGYEESNTDYVLLLDDDVEFESKLIEKLSGPILKNKANITFPIYKGLLPVGCVRSLIAAVTLSAVPSKKSNSFVKILPSAGYSYNSNLDNSLKYLYSESAPGMCVFGERKSIMELELRDELWIDNVGYPLREDAVLMYKAHLQGNLINGIRDVDITHLDAGSSESNRSLKAAYANGYNHLLFWKRFVYNNNRGIKKIVPVTFIIWWAISTLVYLTVKLIASRDIELYKIAVKGIIDGFKDMRKY